MREQNELCEVEMAFFTDVYYCYKSVFKRIINKWPGMKMLDSHVLGFHLMRQATMCVDEVLFCESFCESFFCE